MIFIYYNTIVFIELSVFINVFVQNNNSYNYVNQNRIYE